MSITNTINDNKVINGEVIQASGSFTSKAIELNNLKPNGYFSLQVAVTGSGTAKFEFLCSNNGEVFVAPESSAPIIQDVTTTTGRLVSFSPPPCGWIKIKCSETGSSNTVTVSAWMVVI